MTEAKPTQPNRWDATWGEAATRDRIGDHTAARYRHFRRYIDENDDAVDASLFAELVSVEELRRELQPYEDAGAFLRLALTGDLVEKLQHLNGVLDSAFAGGRVNVPERLRNWQRQLEEERDQRTEMYGVLLQHEERREEALPVEWEDQLELLTVLKAGFETYSEDSKLKEHPLTDVEQQLISSAYDRLASRFGIEIPSLPVWFLAGTDASDASKLTRLGLSSSRPKSGTSEEVMVTASQWWELHHPHIVRFMGACHVGQSPCFVHERTRSLALYLGANCKTRADVWKRLLEAARGVEYLHRRGFVHKHLMPADFLCAEFEAKTLLSGMGLVACPSERSASAPASADIRDAWSTNGGIPECPLVEDKRPSVASDIYALGQCVFAFLDFAETSADLGSAGSVVQCQDLPSHCPEYLDESEWDLIQKMCATDLNHRVNMTYVLEKMHEIAYPVVDEEEEDGGRSTIENLDDQELPGLRINVTVREFLVEFDEFSSEPGEPTRKAFTRLLQLHEMMKEAVPSPEPMVVNKYLSLLSRIMDAMDKPSYSASVQSTGSRYIDQTALTINVEIERLFRLLNFHEGLRVDSAPAFEKSYFEKVQRMARSRIESSVAECDDSADSSEIQTSDEDRREREAVQQYLDRQTGERHDQGNNRASTLPRWFVPQFEVETGAFIAAGGSSSVYRGQWFGTEVVVKEIFFEKGNTLQKRAEFLREANTWFQLNHRNVVKMYGGCHVGRLVFVCEYASQGSLDSFSKSEGRDPLLLWSTLLSAATGLRYLHDVGVVHGDLKGNNILIGKGGVAKLTDFGLSFFRKNADLEAELGALGAYRWKAPECLKGGVATFASDIFSFGMCIIEAVTGAFPWWNLKDEPAVKYHVKKGELPRRPAVFEDEEWDLVQQMCCFDPTQRLNIVSVVVRLTAIVKRRDANRRQLLQTAYTSDMLADREHERMDAHTGGLDTLLQLVQSGVVSRQNAARYSMQTFSELTQGNVLAEQEMLQVVKLFHSDDTKQDWAAIALGYVNIPYSAIREDVTSWLVGLIIERERGGLLKAEAVRAIGYLASDETSRTLIVSHGAIPALLGMIRAGSDAEQAGAARTLGCLAIGCEQNQVAIADAGAIDALVRLILHGAYQQRIEGAFALRRLAEGNAEIGEAVSHICREEFIAISIDATLRDPARILNEIVWGDSQDGWKVRGLFPALVDLMLHGDDQQKNEAQTVLYARGHDRRNERVKIRREPVAILIAFVRVGTAEEKLESARVLGRLADDNDANRIAIAQEGGIAPLVALVRDGTDSQKAKAVEALGFLSDGNDAIRIAIAQEGGIAPLVGLVRDETESQKEDATMALNHLAGCNENNRIGIAQEGDIAPLIALVRDETDSLKEEESKALGHLADGDEDIRIATMDMEDVNMKPEPAPGFPVDSLRGTPDSRRALREVADRSRRMPENDGLYRGLFARFEFAHDHVAVLDPQAKPKRQYCDSLVRFVKLLRPKPPLERLARSEKVISTVNDLHFRLDAVFESVGLGTAPEMTQWKTEWAAGCADQCQKLTDLIQGTPGRPGATSRMMVNEMRSHKRVKEMLTDLFVELKGNQVSQLRPLKQATLDHILAYLQSQPNVPEFIPRSFDWYISEKDVTLATEPFGNGTYGAVSRGTWCHDGVDQDVVVKTLYPETSDAAEGLFLLRLDFWFKLPPHPSILKLHGGCHLSTPPFFVCEEAFGGNIVDFLAKEKNKSKFWPMFFHIAEGLKFLRDHKIVHGGLKGSNILVGKDDMPKLADFGFSQIRSLSAGLSQKSAEAQNNTVRWKPREALQQIGNEAPLFKSDVYSLGMCMIETLTFEAAPFADLDDQEVMDYVSGGGAHPKPNQASDEEWSVIRQLCEVEVQRRPDIDQALALIGQMARLAPPSARTDSQKEDATMALNHLADDNENNRIAIAQEGGIAPLVGLVRDETDSQKEEESKALGHLADGDEDIRIATMDMEDVDMESEPAPGFPVDGLRGIPDSRKVLKQVADRFRWMPENDGLYRGLFARFEFAHDHVAALDPQYKPKRQYCDSLVRFVKLLRRKPLLMRLATNDTTVLKIRELHQDLDVVATELGLADRVEMQWMEQFAIDLSEQYTKLAERITDSSDRMLVNEVHGDKKLQEALMTLHSRLQNTNQTPEMRTLIEVTFKRVSKSSQLEGLRMFDWFISLEDVEYEDEPIGIGTFGNLSRGTWLHDDKRQEVVVKRVWEKDDSSSDDPFLNQLEVWGGIPDHPNILKLHGGCHVSSPQFYVCENASSGNLLDFLAKDENRGLFWRMFLQVAEGLQFLHSQHIVHGGLKCHNILVGDKNVAKLGDFGFSSIRSLSMAMSAASSKVQSGAVRWKPKEMLQEVWGNEPRFESDIYSLGMCMIEAITGAIPFGMMDNKEVMELIMKGGCHPRPDDVEIADETWSLITRLCASDFHDRPTIEVVIEEIRALVKQGAITRDEQEADVPLTTGSQTCGKCRSCQSKLRSDSALCENCRSVSEGPVRGNTLCPECCRNVFTNDEFCRTCGYFLATDAVFA